MAYKQIIDGVGFTMPTKKKWRIACCDCGLVHDVVIVNGRGQVGIAMRRNKRATAARRRGISRLPNVGGKAQPR